MSIIFLWSKVGWESESWHLLNSMKWWFSQSYRSVCKRSRGGIEEWVKMTYALNICHGFLNIFWRWCGIWWPPVMVKFINLFVGMVQLAPSLSCSCYNFSLARRISNLNRLVITFLKLGHCMDSASRSSSFKLLTSSKSNWISVSRSESLLCWSAIFVGVGIIIVVLVFDQWVSSFPSLYDFSL